MVLISTGRINGFFLLKVIEEGNEDSSLTANIRELNLQVQISLIAKF